MKTRRPGLPRPGTLRRATRSSRTLPLRPGRRDPGSALPATWAGLLLLLVALAAGPLGCRTAARARTADRPQILRPGESLDTSHLELSPEDERLVEAFARFTAGRIEEMADAPEAAITHYLAAVENDPANEALALDVAAKLIELRRLAEARTLLEAMAARPEASGLAWGWLGLVHALQGDRDAAIAANQEAIRRTPGNVGAYQNLARIYLGAGQVQEAVAVLEEAARQRDADSRFLLLIADTLGALQQLKDPALGDLRPRIVALLDRAAALNPEKPAERLRLADLYQLFGEGAKALPLYQGLVEEDPDLPGLRERLAEIYLRTDDREKAAEQLRVLVRTQPTNPLPHYYLGVLALEAKHFDEAVSAFNRVLVLRPDNEAIHFDLAVAHLSHRRPADALAVLERARARFRPSFRLEFYTAAALLDLKRYEEAIRHFTAAEIIGGATSPEDLTAAFYFQCGVASERAKQFDDAAVHFEKAIELEEDFAEALNYLGYMWAEQGVHLDRARELIERAVKLEPDNEAFLDSLAWVLHQQGRSAEALPHQLRALQLSKEPDATLYEHLGDIYLRLDRRDDARQAWQKAQELEPKPEVRQKLERLDTPAAP